MASDDLPRSAAPVPGAARAAGVTTSGGAPSHDPWRIDPGLAAATAEVLGWSAEAGVVELVRALPSRMPMGSTAKLEAVAAGRTPPGADPEAVARRLVDDRAADRPEVSWSCWAAATLMASLLVTLGERRADVTAIRRIDDAAPPVDVHSLVAVDGLLCDPYFGAVVAGPGSEEVEGTLDGVWCRRTDEPDGRWGFDVANGRWGRHLAYRLLARVVDRGDVEALCVVSVLHTGAPTRPFARVWSGSRGWEAFTHGDGSAATRTWTWAGPDRIWEGEVDQAEHPDWPAAAADFAARAGIRLA